MQEGSTSSHLLDRERPRSLGWSGNGRQTVRTALDGSIATRYAEGNMEFDVA